MMQVDMLFDEVVRAREQLRNMTVGNDCHDYEVLSLPCLSCCASVQ